MIIGIAGRRESGKDYYAKVVQQMFPQKPLITRFAARLYKMAAVVDPVFAPDMAHASKAEYVCGRKEFGTRREFIQKLGTEFGRDLIHPTLWTVLTMETAQQAPAGAIIADVRFPQEQDAILASGGIIIHLRPDWEPTDNHGSHRSEQTLPIVNPIAEAVVALQAGEYYRGAADVTRTVDSLLDSVAAIY